VRTGVQLLLDGVRAYLPCPTEVANTALDIAKGEQQFILKCDMGGPFVGLAFKLEEGRCGGWGGVGGPRRGVTPTHACMRTGPRAPPALARARGWVARPRGKGLKNTHFFTLNLQNHGDHEPFSMMPAARHPAPHRALHPASPLCCVHDTQPR
jgi:hypothetical protein